MTLNKLAIDVLGNRALGYLFRTILVQHSGGNIQCANIHGPFDDVIRSPFQLSKSKVCLRLSVDVRKDTLDETLPKIAPILRFVIARIKKDVSLHH